MMEEADATIAQIGPTPRARIVDLGWSSGLVGGNNIESSAILKPIMRLYGRTGHARYLDFARYIVEIDSWEGKRVLTWLPILAARKQDDSWK